MIKLQKKQILTKVAATAMAASLVLGSGGTQTFAQEKASNMVGRAKVTVELRTDSEYAHMSISTSTPNTSTNAKATVYYQKNGKNYQHSASAVGTTASANSVTASAQKQRYAAVVTGGKGEY